MKILKVSDPELNYQGFIAIDSLQNGLAFGGCRFSTGVTEEEVAELAACMSLKLVPHGLPVGGAKGGLAVDPKSQNIKAIVADFARKMQNTLTTSVVLGKDLGATDVIMDHLYQSIESPQMAPAQQKHPGKSIPNRLRDMIGYQSNMTGKGVAWAGYGLCGDKIKNQKVAIQGAGAVGVGSAIRLLDMGARIVAISDKKHSVTKTDGFSREQLAHFIENGEILQEKASSLGQVDLTEKLFSVNADMTVLAATSNSVTDNMAAAMISPLVIEGSNFGLTPSARNLLHQRGIFVVPDVIASSSSAAMVAYQMASGNSLSEEKLWSLIQFAIINTTKDLVTLAKSEKMEPRMAFKSILAPRMIQNSQRK